MEEIEEDEQGEISSAISAWFYRQLEGRETLKWLVSHVFIYVGMILLIFGYCVIGAFTFQYLENSAIHEKRLKEGASKCLEELNEQASKNRIDVLEKIYNKTRDNILSDNAQSSMKEMTDKNQQKKLDGWLLSVKEVVMDYEDKLKAHQESMARCKEELAVGDDWEFQTALLFASTVVTTIGYGNRTPKSWRGRLCTLLYAMLGVPLMLFCLRTLGRNIGRGLDFLYNKALAYWSQLRESHQEGEEFSSPLADASQPGSARESVAPGGLPSIALTSDGPDGNIRPLSAMGEDNGDDHRHAKSREHGARSARQLRIPLALVFLITTLYNAIGAALFSHYERWSFLDGFYFTFITISTIGFGDLVPRVLTDDDPEYGSTPRWWVETSYVLYVTLGLTIIQMSFDLTRDTINYQFYQLGQTVGVLQQREPSQRRQSRRESRREERRKSTRRHRHDSGPSGLLRPSFGGGRLSALGGGSRSPSMRSAELGSGQHSTAPSSAESMPRPERPRSALPRRPDHPGPDD